MVRPVLPPLVLRSALSLTDGAHAAVVITFAGRTALQRARKGGFKDMSVQELLIAFFKVRIRLLFLALLRCCADVRWIDRKLLRR